MSPKDEIIKVTKKYDYAMFCDRCDRITISTNTTYRTYKSGTEVKVEHCEECKCTQETEYIAYTVSIKTKN